MTLASKHSLTSHIECVEHVRLPPDYSKIILFIIIIILKPKYRFGDGVVNIIINCIIMCIISSPINGRHYKVGGDRVLPQVLIPHVAKSSHHLILPPGQSFN